MSAGYWDAVAPSSKPVLGILGDVEGRIVPVAPPQFFLDPSVEHKTAPSETIPESSVAHDIR